MTSLLPRRRPIIALVGVDGSGKTTQAHRLARWLTDHGTPTGYWLNAGGRRWLGRLAQRLGRVDAEDLLGPAGVLRVESVLRWLAISRALAWSRLTRRAMVMDRYTFCQYASVRARGGVREARVRGWYKLFPAPDVTFLLTVAPAEAYRRIDVRGTDQERPEFLAAFAAAYPGLPEADGFIRIDADRPPDQVFQALTGHLGYAAANR